MSELPLRATNALLGGCNGLAKLPYVRDGRRALGFRSFRLGVEDVTGVYREGGAVTARVFEDRVALGYYNIDIHPLQDCSYEDVPSNTSLPFFLPLRALLTSAADNLVVAGRAMAQSFHAAAATRTHATEFHSGVAAFHTAALLCR